MKRVNRREFLKPAAAVPGALLVSKGLSMTLPARKGEGGKLLNAYYLRAEMYTMVPRHIREDLEWMASIGTNAVSIAILEQDLFAAQRNVELIHREASRLKMKVFATPSRWGGLVAGAPKVPSLFSVLHPETWVLSRDGSPARFPTTSGVMSSVYHPATYEFFCQSTDKLFREFDLDGITWDEPKAFHPDYSKAALASLGPQPTRSDFSKGTVDFYARVSRHTRQLHPDKTINMFLMATNRDEEARLASAIPDLDYFGCDGRPWSAEADLAAARRQGRTEHHPKVLVGRGEFFLRLAREHGKKGLLLIENLSMPASMIPVMDVGLKKVLALNPDQLLYYYYGRDIEDPDRNMAVIARHLRKFRT
jgi:hypothetical protein